jgi:hypothetical protein
MEPSASECAADDRDTLDCRVSSRIDNRDQYEACNSADESCERGLDRTLDGVASAPMRVGQMPLAVRARCH